MTILSVYYASAPASEVPISTLEVACPVFETIWTCAGFEDQALTLETGETVTFEASGLDVALPARNTTGQQDLTFAIENVTGTAQNRIDTVLDSPSPEVVTVRYRLYLASDRTAPKMLLTMIMTLADFQGPTSQITASYMDLINRAWPRDRYTATFAPGIRYISS